MGYCFSHTRQELRDKFKGLPGPEIGKLRKQLVSITKEMEKTMSEDCRENADRTKHALWSEHSETTFVSVHLSDRWSVHLLH